ncbi:MAG: hypothetical protein NTY19_14660 [Planctomycetota bacterium]|nr:hypothetical protein [Planctomycetota bacterium]
MGRWASVVCCAWVLLQGLAVCAGAADANAGETIALPDYRVEADGFGAREADIRAVLDSVRRELGKCFPDYTIEPIVVTRGRSGPITLFQRNDCDEIVIRLDTEKTYWSQYAYQFAHEFCHVLCGYRDADRGNKWFEETLCETASLYAMQSMARTWRKSPPYANWKDYRDSLRDYVDDVVRKRDKVYELYAKGLAEFYRVHRTELEKNPGSRDLNGAMSLVLLQLFEERSDRWEAVRWLNSTPASEGDTFLVYLQKWHDAAPAKHQPFVKKVADLYGVAIKSNAPPESVVAPAKVADGDRSLLKLRVQADGFQASEQDIQAVLGSASHELYRFFPGYQIEPVLVVCGRNGPTVLYARNSQGEVVVQLDTEQTSWCQYANQFSYLFANILCGFNEKSVGHSWFEASLCEAAAAFALKQMSKTWEQNPPYPNWKDYRHALAKYVQEAISQRQKLEPDGLQDFYQQHREELAQGTDTRPLSQAIAVVLLQLFEEHPEQWEAIRWLNSAPSPKGEAFEKYLQRWHDAVPKQHQPFVQRIADLFGVPIKPA